MTRRAAGLAALVLAVAACGTGPAATRLPDAGPQPGFAKNPVPAPSGLLTAGQLTVGIVPSLPVQQYLDHRSKPAGFDVDLMNAIGSQVGLRVSYQEVASEAEIAPGVTAPGRTYEIGMADQVESSGLTSAIKSLEYFTTGQTILVADGDSRTTGLGSLCGEKVGALRASGAEDEVLRQNENGCPGHQIQYQVYDDGSKGVQDLKAGKLGAYVDEYASSVYFAHVYGGLKVVPHLIAPNKEVMLFSISDTNLHDAVATALDRLKSDGTYSRLLHQWGLDLGSV